MNHHIKKLVLSALFASLSCMMTMVIQIPAPTGYVNLGDCAVLLGAWVLGPLWGGAAAGVGTMLADVLNGWASYAPATFVIKFVMAAVAASLFQIVKGRWGKFLGAVTAELLMASGYFLYESLVLGVGTAALATVPANLIQGVAGVASGMAVSLFLEQSGALAQLKQ